MYKKKCLKIVSLLLLLGFIFLSFYIRTFDIFEQVPITELILNGKDKISWATCNHLVNKGNIHILNNKRERDLMFKHKYPPYLISYPGSGNTFTRMLIEYITNIYTGSIYTDNILMKEHGFEGEKYCFNEVSVIKLHPDVLNDKYHLWINGSCPCACDDKLKNYKGDNEFKEISHYNNIWKPLTGIFIVRDPWSAIFAWYQCHESHKSKLIDGNIKFNKTKNNVVFDEKTKHSHVNHVRKSDFDPERFRNFIEPQVKKYMQLFKTIQDFEANNYDYIVIKFERLISIVNEAQTFSEMHNILQFLYTKRYYYRNKKILKQKIKCLNLYIMRNDKRMNSIKRSSNDIFMKAYFVTKDYAYESLHKTFLCDMWAKMEKELKPYGYNVWNNIDCTPK